MQVFIQLVTLQSSSCYPYVAQARIAKPASPLFAVSFMQEEIKVLCSISPLNNLDSPFH